MKRIQPRQVLAAAIALAIAIPAGALPANSPASTNGKSSRAVDSKSSVQVVGILTAGKGVALRNAIAPAGTTIYSGDALATFAHGAIVAAGDSQLRFGTESRAKLSRVQNRVQVAIERGRVGLRSSAVSPLEARLADATITLGDAAIAGIAMLNENKAMVGVERGTATLRAGADGKPVTLRAGEAMEITLAAAPAPQGGANSSGARTLSRGKVAILGAVLIGGISVIAWSIQHDNDLPRGPKQDLISPFVLR